MDMDKIVNVYIEIEKESNMKYEYDKEVGKLVIDRVLPYPYYYPYAYGFIENTMAKDNDELDALIITNKKIEKDTWTNAYIVGVLIMEDENGMDEKILCVLEEDYHSIKDLGDLTDDIKDNIHWFFTNYKKKTQGKWSNVFGYENKEYAIELHKISQI